MISAPSAQALATLVRAEVVSEFVVPGKTRAAAPTAVEGGFASDAVREGQHGVVVTTDHYFPRRLGVVFPDDNGTQNPLFVS